MGPNDFLDALERLIATLNRNKSKNVRTVKERNHLRSFVGAWFGVYRPGFLKLIAEEEYFLPIDEIMQSLLKFASKESSRFTYKSLCRDIQNHFCDSLLVPLSRAYWSRAPETAPAGRDSEVARKLGRLDSDLAESYEQVVEDLIQVNRKTYRGTAAELREVIRGVLDKLAPDNQVKSTDWFKATRSSGAKKEENPTQSEKTKYIMRQRGLGSAATDAAESYMSSLEERLGHVVRATYRRASNSTHTGGEKEEIAQQLRYTNALLAELLPPEE
jgi:hypothetical protein